MLDDIRKLCRDLLESKKVEGVLGVYEKDGQAAPYLFTKSDEINNLSISKKYLLLNTVKPLKQNILRLIQQKYPDKKLAVVARGCDERALFELSKRDQIKLENLEII